MKSAPHSATDNKETRRFWNDFAIHIDLPMLQIHIHERHRMQIIYLSVFCLMDQQISTQ